MSCIDSRSSLKSLHAFPAPMSIGGALLMYVPFVSKLRVPFVPWLFDSVHEDLYIKKTAKVDEAFGSPICADYATLRSRTDVAPAASASSNARIVFDVSGIIITHFVWLVRSFGLCYPRCSIG